MDYFSKVFYGNTLTEWAVAFGIFVLSFLIGKIVYYTVSKFGRRLSDKTKTKLDDIFLDMLEEPLVTAIVLLGISIGVKTLTLPVKFEVFFTHAYQGALILTLTWLVARLFSTISDNYLAPIVKSSEGELDDQLYPILRKGITLSIWTLGFIAALNNAGYDVAAILAGLGIGGLAFALAAQDTVSNLFGGFTIFTDRPFLINERIQIDGIDGTVVEVGIRSTRIRTLEGRIVTLPNKVFTSSAVTNVTSEPSRKVVLNLGLTYDMKAAQIKEAMQSFKDIVAQNENTEEEALVSFNNFGDFSLGILCIYYIKKGADIMQTQSEINLSILEVFGDKGLEMAFPTQTIHLEK